MTKLWSAAAIAVTMALSTTPAHAQKQTMAGSWEGVGFQVNPDRQETTWDIAMTLQPGATSTVEYPSLRCKADLKETSRRADMIEFEEIITSGDCENGGHITLTLRADRVAFFWWKPGSGIDASAVLHRAKTS